jgi:hypothetical protein
MRRHGAAADFASVRINGAQSRRRSTGGSTTTLTDASALPGVAAGRTRLSVFPPSPQTPLTVRSISVLGRTRSTATWICVNPADAVIAITDRIAELTGKVEAGPDGAAGA